MKRIFYTDRRVPGTILGGIAAAAALLLLVSTATAAAPPAAAPRVEAARKGTNILPRKVLAAGHYGNDAPWYEANIPFFDCSDPDIARIYYYRWKLFKSHLRDLGDRGYIVTEFLDDVGWSLKPYESLNDATGFHIREGRWLRDPRYINDYVDFMYHGGNDRHFSEPIADAAYAHFLVHRDRAAAIRNLAAMKRLYRAWDDHYDASKGLYYIEPLLDATEYTVSSIDATGGKEGFRGGDAFRPSINSFMFANAAAISRLSEMVGDEASAREFTAKAEALRDRVQASLWNTDLQHFVDRYKVSNQFVRYWDFIRGRELAGYTPWYFGLPGRDEKYSAAWAHLLSGDRLGGAHGLRTVEPSYEYYMKQYRFVSEGGSDRPECQWNGPSWPFQTTLALGGLANLLNDYPEQRVIGAGDYLRLLQQYARQHFMNGEPDLQEDYNPDTGAVIVGLSRSHHYNHSGFNDLVITGLAGLRPRRDDILEVNPLIPTAAKGGPELSYFCLENVPYHGRLVTIVYDRLGTRYKKGAGLSVYVDGARVSAPAPPGRRMVALPKSTNTPAPPVPANLAVNLRRSGFPAPAASANGDAKEMYQAVDGRVWYYPNVRNFWTNSGSPNRNDWFALDLGQTQTVDSVRLYFYADKSRFAAPARVRVQSWTGQKWSDVTTPERKPAAAVANGETVVRFTPVRTGRLRALFENPRGASVALVEMKAFGSKTVAPKELSGLPPGAAGLPSNPAGLTGENWHTGVFNGARWLDATDGGYVAIDLPAQPSAPNTLVVTYWGSDVGNRRFDILVGGVKVGEQVLENSRPGEFFDVAYPIPETVTRGKKNVTVRFQAKPGATAGGVFGARIERR